MCVATACLLASVYSMWGTIGYTLQCIQYAGIIGYTLQYVLHIADYI